MLICKYVRLGIKDSYRPTTIELIHAAILFFVHTLTLTQACTNTNCRTYATLGNKMMMVIMSSGCFPNVSTCPRSGRYFVCSSRSALPIHDSLRGAAHHGETTMWGIHSCLAADCGGARMHAHVRHATPLTVKTSICLNAPARSLVVVGDFIKLRNVVIILRPAPYLPSPLDYILLHSLDATKALAASIICLLCLL